MIAWPMNPGDVIANRWTITGSRAVIALGLSFNVKNIETGAEASCMLQPMIFDNVDWRRIERSVMIVKELTLRGLSSIPRFIEYNEVHLDGVHRYRYLCTMRVGQTLRRLERRIQQVDNNNRFSLFTCLHLGFETLNAVKEFHDAGYLHRTLRPNAFSVMPSFSPGVVMFPPSLYNPRRWLDFDGASRIPARTNPPAPTFVSRAHASVRALRGEEQTRLDDLWSWFYTLVDLTVGLDWPPFENGAVGLAGLAAAKEALHERPSEWLQSAPEEYVAILSYLKSSSPEDEPDYSRLYQLVSKATKRAVQDTNGQATLDWEPGGQYHEILRLLVYGDETDIANW